MKKMQKSVMVSLMMSVIGAGWLLTERFAHRIPLGGPITDGLRGYGWIFWILLLSGLWGCVRCFFPKVQITIWEGFFRNHLPELLILVLTLCSLWVLMDSGYYWDDAVNSTQYLAEKYDDVPLWRNVLHFMGEYLRLGRINILSFYYYFFFYIENVSVYKGLILLLTAMDQVIFSLLLQQLGYGRKTRCFGMMLLPVLIQLRAYQDPVSGFYGLMQVLSAEMMLAVLFEIRWLREGKGKDLSLSLLFFSVGLMTYEVCFPFIALLFLMAWVWRKSFWKAVRGMIPYMAVMGLMLAGIVFVRTRFAETSTYVGVTFSLDLLKILRAYWYQVTAALPLSMYMSRHEWAIMGQTYLAETVMPYRLGDLIQGIRGEDILLSVLALCLLAQLFGHKDEGADGPVRGNDWALLCLGAGFLLLPGLTVAISQRYQGQLFQGQGYLPVYMEYFGTAALILWLGRWIASRLQGEGRSLFYGVCGTAYMVILLISVQNHRAVTKAMNRSFYDPWKAGTAALRGGILDFLPQDAVVLADNDETYIWESNWNAIGNYAYYNIFSGREDIRAGGKSLLRDGIPEKLYLISYAGDAMGGMTRLGHVTGLDWDSEGDRIRSAETDEVLYFMSGDWANSVSTEWTDANGTFKQVTAREASRVRSTKDGTLYRLEAEERIRFESLSVDWFAKNEW